MKKKSKIGLTIVSVVLVVILVAGLIYFFGASYPAYEVLAKEEFNISGLSEGFIPQGISYDRVSGKFLLSGYMNDTSKPSRVYVVDSETQDEKYVTFTDGGEDYFGHAGGVAVYGNFAYIAGDGKVHEVNLDDVLNANNGDKVEFQYTLDPGNGADCLTVNGNELWVGEFYKKGKYETDESHHLTNSAGETNMAVSFAFALDASGIVSDVPIRGLSTPNQLQGIEFLGEDRVMISTSYSLPNSKLHVFENVFGVAPEHSLEVNGASVPVFVLSSANCVLSIDAPCMSEEIVLANNKVYILYESACSKYKLFTRTRVKNVHSIKIEDLLSAGE
ncbi:MAG: hypothetical protein IJW24_00265 [Clostridia bacterium]|nr:hypothetical protein [Clostridia bacterium]